MRETREMEPLLSIVHLRHLAPLFLFAMVFHLFLLLAETTPSNVNAGSSLKPPNYITSPSGDFGFGFRALDSDPASFLLAIWFQLDGTVVWFAADADTGSAVVATGQSVLSLTVDGQLFLANSPGPGTWNASHRSHGSVLVLQLQDNGNLQLLDAAADNNTNTAGAVAWESFGHPTDTLLPGQIMRPGTILRSRRAADDFSSPGHVRFNVQGDGNIVFYNVDLTGNFDPAVYGAYWSSGTATKDKGGGNTTLFFDVEIAGLLYYTLADGSKHNLTAPPQSLHTTSRFYQRATLDPDGVLRVYNHPNKDSTGNAPSSWAVVSMLPAGDGCRARTSNYHGVVCGPNSFCIHDPNNQQRMGCECLSGHVFLDVQSRYKGCTLGFSPQSCDGKGKRRSTDEFQLVELRNTYWQNLIYNRRHESVTEGQCRDLCLSNCFCTAVMFRRRQLFRDFHVRRWVANK